MFGKGKDWHKVRSTHASVLESLEQVIARHPANPQPAARGGRVIAFEESALGSAHSAEPADAVVLQFRPRLSLVRSGPDGAA